MLFVRRQPCTGTKHVGAKIYRMLEALDESCQAWITSGMVETLGTTGEVMIIAKVGKIAAAIEETELVHSCCPNIQMNQARDEKLMS